MTATQPPLPYLHDTPGLLRHLVRLTRYLPLDGSRVAYVRVYAKLCDAGTQEARCGGRRGDQGAASDEGGESAPDY
jgi:hypothetical protein